jgi:hypothetical protein
LTCSFKLAEAHSIGDGLEVVEQSFPGAIGRPAQVALVDGLPRAERFREFSPLHPGAKPVDDPVDHLAVVPPQAASVVAHRQQ